jgi:hypothetical protein
MVFVEKLWFSYEKQWKWSQGLITAPYGVPPSTFYITDYTMKPPDPELSL